MNSNLHDSACECRLIEELVPFLDHDIHDPAALQLGSHLKRKHRSSPPPKASICQTLLHMSCIPVHPVWLKLVLWHVRAEHRAGSEQQLLPGATAGVIRPYRAGLPVIWGKWDLRIDPCHHLLDPHIPIKGPMRSMGM
jgi:hypothetical protein